MRLSPALTLCLSLTLTGCALQNEQPSANIPAAALAGSVFGGTQPVAGSTVTLYAVGTSYGAGATIIASATAVTDATGGFSFAPFTCPYANTPTYLLVSGGNAGGGINTHIALAAAAGPCSGLANATVNVNEVTTAATAYALSHFFTTTLGGATTTDLFGGHSAGSGVYNTGLVNADFYTVPELVNLAAPSTTAARTTNTTAGITTTYETAKLYTLANIIASCVNSSGSTAAGTNCGTFFTNTTDNGGTAPADTLQAAVQMALYPYKNVATLYNLQTATPPFAGGLSTTPNDWSLGVSYTSAAFQLGVFSSATYRSASNIDIDAAGNIWFPTNSSASHGVAEFSPLSATPAFAGPYLTTLTHPQYLAITNQSRIYATDTAGTRILYTTTTSPSTSGPGGGLNDFTGPLTASPTTNAEAGDDILFTYGGTASTLGTNSYRIGYNFPATDGNDYTDLYTFATPPSGFAGSGGNSNNYVVASASGSNTLCYQYYGTGTTNTAAVQNASTGTAPCYTGLIASTGPSGSPDWLMTVPSTNSLCDYGENASSGTCFTPTVPLSSPEGVATDGDGNVWIANYANASVSTLGFTYSSGTYTDFHATSNLAYIHNATNGATLTNPMGIAIDNSGNVWVSNACFTADTTCTLGSFTLSELIGAAAPTVTPLAAAVLNNLEATRPQLLRNLGTNLTNTQPTYSPKIHPTPTPSNPNKSHPVLIPIL